MPFKITSCSRRFQFFLFKRCVESDDYLCHDTFANAAKKRAVIFDKFLLHTMCMHVAFITLLFRCKFRCSLAKNRDVSLRNLDQIKDGARVYLYICITVSSTIQLRLFDTRSQRDRSFLRFQSKHSVFRFTVENVCTQYHVVLNIFHYFAQQIQ